MVDSVGIEDIRLCHHSDGRKVVRCGEPWRERGGVLTMCEMMGRGRTRDPDSSLLGTRATRFLTQSSESRNDAFVMIKTESRIARGKALRRRESDAVGCGRCERKKFGRRPN